MKRFSHGPLTHQNAEALGQRIREVLAAKLFTVATVNLEEFSHKIDVENEQYLLSDWTDKTNELVRVRVEEEFATIHFAGLGYNYIYNSRLKSGGDHESFKYPYFSFEHNGFHIQWRPNGEHKRLLTFKVERDLPWDIDAYHERDLRIHFAAAGLEIPHVGMA